MSYKVAVDIGGTTFSFVIFNTTNCIFKSKIFNIKIYKKYETFLKKLVFEINKETKEIIIDLIGIACPGPLDSNTGEIFNTPNLTILRYVNLKKDIQKYIKCNKIMIENDANIYSLGSYYALKNKKKTDILLGITLGTGIGFGIIINGQLFKGNYGMAGEYELSPLNNDITWADLIGYKFFRTETINNFDKILTPKEIFDLSEKNNKKAINIWKQYGINIGLCLCHIIGILNPNYLSIGGGISKANKYFHTEMIKTIEKKCLIYKKELVTVRYDNNLIPNIFLGWF